MQFETNYYKLANGVRVLQIPIANVESVTALVLVRTGSRNEEEKEAGISHILEHMVLKASKKYPTQMMLSSAIDSMGAEHNAFTGKEYTGYYITCAASHLPKALDILGDVITNPLLKEENLTTEKGVIVEEYNMYQDLPMRRAPEEFENLLWSGTKMGRFIEGNPKTIMGASAIGLKKYMDKWYRGSNVLVVVAGKLDKLDQLIEDNFGGVAGGELSQFVEETKFATGKEKFVEKKTEQAHFVIGVPGISMQDPRRYALSIAQVVLGGPMSSRLFDEIREKRGLAYYVRAEDETVFDSGYFAVRAGVKLDKLGEAMEVVKHEMLRLADTFTETDLKLGKDYVLGRLPLQLEGTMDVAQFYGLRTLLADEIRHPGEVVSNIQKVSVEDVAEVVRELVKEEEMRSVVVGPKGE